MARILRAALRVLLALPMSVFSASEAEYAGRRAAMIEEVRAMHGAALEPRVAAALLAVPRHRFVPDANLENAYENRPLPIGRGQTISQPYIVALMSELLRVRPGDRVLEVGTGSGYQAAVLARLAARVYSIEIVTALADEARERLARLGYANVEVRAGDGYEGWPEAAPFDAIMVTAGAPHVPPALAAQLKPGGRMVIPVGPAGAVQRLTLLEKRADGSVHSREIVPVRFVPLTRERR